MNVISETVGSISTYQHCLLHHKEKVFHVHRLSAPQSSSAIPHHDSALRTILKASPHLFSPTKCSGWEENQIQSSGKHQYSPKFTWQEEEETKAISYTLHLSSLGQTNTQYIIRLHLPKGNFSGALSWHTRILPHLFRKDSQHLCPILRSWLFNSKLYSVCPLTLAVGFN